MVFSKEEHTNSIPVVRPENIQYIQAALYRLKKLYLVVYLYMHIYRRKINEKRANEFEKAQKWGIWEDLEEGKGRGNDVIIIKLQKHKKFLKNVVYLLNSF